MAKSYELRKRTYDFAIGIVRLCRTYPHTLEGRVFSEQLIRAGTSVAANYRGACRGRSGREFIAKIGTVIEEADELVAIFTRALRTARQTQEDPHHRTWQPLPGTRR